MKKNNEILKWNYLSWLWVFFCLIGIYATIPIARSIQKVISDTVGREFFTYIVIFTVCAALIGGLYVLLRKIEVRKASQYLWVLLCGGLYIFFTLQLRKYPEEAFHLVEYGILAFFLFNALSHTIRDRTIYFTAGLLVLFFGITDEAIQWLMPGRFWGVKDVIINVLGGGIFLLALARGIRPSTINRGITKTSVNILMGVIVINLVMIGFCLSNTPDMVVKYTSFSDALTWLRHEEPMTEYGHKHSDPRSSMITAFSLKQAWTCIAAALVLLPVAGYAWKKKLSAC